MSYTPQTLADIVGQPRLGVFRQWAKAPDARCWLFAGKKGTGKTATADCLANDLGADVTDECGAELTLTNVRDLARLCQCRPMFGKWRILHISEMEKLDSRVEAFIKDWLEERSIPPHLIVIATTNLEVDPNASEAHLAFLERFTRVDFGSSKVLADAMRPKLEALWNAATAGAPLPPGMTRIGWNTDKTAYSARLALRQLRDAIMLWQAEQADRAEAAGLRILTDEAA